MKFTYDTRVRLTHSTLPSQLEHVDLAGRGGPSDGDAGLPAGQRQVLSLVAAALCLLFAFAFSLLHADRLIPPRSPSTAESSAGIIDGVATAVLAFLGLITKVSKNSNKDFYEKIYL